MKLYALVHRTFDHGSRFGPGLTNTSFDLYEKKEGALAEMDRIYAEMSSKSFLRVEPHENGQGFSYAGNYVSFIPGSYTVEERETK